jgi:CHAD domain-containing protein
LSGVEHLNDRDPGDPVVRAHRRLDAALGDYAASELQRAIACLAWRGSRLHDGIHQARKSLRRTRSVLALGSPLLGPGATLIDRECRRMNRELSELRDAQALVSTLDHLIDKGDAAECLPVLRRVRRIAARARAERARLALAGKPDLDDARALLTTLLAALPSLPWQNLTDASVTDAFAYSVRRADEAGERARTSERAADWHRWRRRARRVSQQYRALADLIEHAPGVKKRSKTLAILLGEAQDYALLREYSRRGSMFAEADRQVLRRLGATGMQQLRERIATSAGAKPAVGQPGGEPTPN